MSKAGLFLQIVSSGAQLNKLSIYHVDQSRSDRCWGKHCRCLFSWDYKEVDSFLFLLTSVGFRKLVKVTCLIIYDRPLQDAACIQKDILTQCTPTNALMPVKLTMQVQSPDVYVSMSSTNKMCLQGIKPLDPIQPVLHWKNWIIEFTQFFKVSGCNQFILAT